jgi:hypothetical protein
MSSRKLIGVLVFFLTGGEKNKKIRFLKNQDSGFRFLIFSGMQSGVRFFPHNPKHQQL